MKDWLDGKTQFTLIYLARKVAISGHPFSAGIAKNNFSGVRDINLVSTLLLVKGERLRLFYFSWSSVLSYLCIYLLLFSKDCLYISSEYNTIPLNHSKNMWPPSETFFLSLSLKERKKVKICDSRAREASLVYSSCFIFWWKVNWFLETQFVLTHSRTRQVAKCKFSFCRDSVQKSPTS